MKNKKYKHSTTAQLKPVSLRLRVAVADAMAERTHLLIVVLQLTYVFYEKMDNIWPVEELSIYV